MACLLAASCQVAAPKPDVAAHATRQELIGAWRLQNIQLTGPNGAMNDPFYNEGSTGILIYDPSGWMSVQIVGAPRGTVEVPVARPTPNGTAEDARRQAEVLDTYYAYFATWDFDPASSTVTHHVVSSLFPSESGMSYSQNVSVEGDYLIFTTKRSSGVLQKKIWQKIGGQH